MLMFLRHLRRERDENLTGVFGHPRAKNGVEVNDRGIILLFFCDGTHEGGNAAGVAWSNELVGTRMADEWLPRGLNRETNGWRHSAED